MKVPFNDNLEIPSTIIRLLFSSSQEKRLNGIKELESFFKSNIDPTNEDIFNSFIKNYKLMCYDKLDQQSISSRKSSLSGIVLIINIISKLEDVKTSSLILLVEFLITMLKETYSDIKLAVEITSILDRLLKNQINLVLECFNELFAVIIYLYSNCSQELSSFVINLDDILKDLISQAYRQGLMSKFKIDSFYTVVENGLSVLS
jgi:hypothetical protein